MYLIDPSKKQFKANLHCHSVLSDGKMTPQELKDAYKAQGYSVLAITDHETPKDHSAMNDPDFLMLTGYEAYVRPDPGCKYDPYAPEVHINLFARDPHNEYIICYNPACCRYMKPEDQALLKKVGSQEQREYTVEYVNKYLATAKEYGYIASYNHPVWSMEAQERILSYEGFFSLELYNFASNVANGMEHSGDLYDKLLLKGRRMYVHAGDDNHNRFPADHPHWDSFGGITMIMADALEYDKVFEAMEKGDMYATTGPVFEEIRFDGENVHIKCSPVKSLFCYGGHKAPAYIHAPEGQYITEATLRVLPDARYVRVSAIDEKGGRADTRGFFRDELGLAPL